MITRRHLLAAAAWPAFGWTAAALAQATQTPAVIGLLNGRSCESSERLHAAFREGIANLTSDISEKYLELLLAAALRLRRIGFLLDTTGANHALFVASLRRSASQYSVDARFADVGRLEEVEPALLRLAKEGAQALVVLPSPGFFPTEQNRPVSARRCLCRQDIQRKNFVLEWRSANCLQIRTGVL